MSKHSGGSDLNDSHHRLDLPIRIPTQSSTRSISRAAAYAQAKRSFSTTLSMVMALPTIQQNLKSAPPPSPGSRGLDVVKRMRRKTPTPAPVHPPRTSTGSPYAVKPYIAPTSHGAETFPGPEDARGRSPSPTRGGGIVPAFRPGGHSIAPNKPDPWKEKEKTPKKVIVSGLNRKDVSGSLPVRRIVFNEHQKPQFQHDSPSSLMVVQAPTPPASQQSSPLRPITPPQGKTRNKRGRVAPLAFVETTTTEEVYEPIYEPTSDRHSYLDSDDGASIEVPDDDGGSNVSTLISMFRRRKSLEGNPPESSIPIDHPPMFADSRRETPQATPLFPSAASSLPSQQIDYYDVQSDEGTSHALRIRNSYPNVVVPSVPSTNSMPPTAMDNSPPQLGRDWNAWEQPSESNSTEPKLSADWSDWGSKHMTRANSEAYRSDMSDIGNSISQVDSVVGTPQPSQKNSSENLPAETEYEDDFVPVEQQQTLHPE